MYSSKTADAPETVKLIERCITRFGIPQQTVHDNGTAFLSIDFVHWTHEFGITLKPRTSYSPWTNGKVEVQNMKFANYRKPIKIGRKVLLENHVKGFLKSKKLLELRSGPFTVTRLITNTTYGIVHDMTEQKKVVHRNHLVEYFPKEREIDKLVQDYSTNYVYSQAYYDRFNQYSIDRFNHQTTDNPEYMPWPIINNANNQAE